ncbi:helix-turn-helix transcriptional regulator [Bacillus sp. B1-b2]|uniref:helix-turn-helix transcriptional regulator n=1 Tax=Bacillus sp. B1-b2 TaxID=2653201 RepID=UPI00126201C9|nr:AraC family transcriptional regulator [Bacillus sp. B1-b2]KAB7672604.1 helix-turn-helix transcriptional regulator [Bacillus sp. B1-b2]
MKHYEVIENALIHIENNLSSPLSLESVADTFNMSKYYFHRLFSAMMGCSLNSYILSRRLNTSLNFIQNNHMTLTEIAYQLSFGTQASFTRAFKRHYGITPSSIREKAIAISPVQIPSVAKRPIKNINGDIVTDFTLMNFEAIRLSGIVFEVDLATDDYRKKIRSQAKLLLDNIHETINGPCFVVYSDCQPNSTQFKVLFGIPYDIQINKPYYFTVDVPQLFCAKFQYSGDLLEIGDILKSDYARFLKISRQEAENSHIELIQVFDNVHQLNAEYQVYTPIKKLPIDSDEKV